MVLQEFLSLIFFLAITYAVLFDSGIPFDTIHFLITFIGGNFPDFLPFSIIDGKVIFENGKTQDDISAYMNNTYKAAWDAKYDAEIARQKSKLELTPKEKSLLPCKIEETVKFAKELRTSEDKTIIENQKRLGLPSEVNVPLSDSTGETLAKMEAGEPVINARLKEASKDLYSRYKGLLAEKNNHNRKNTTEQIDKVIVDLEGKIEKLETRLQEQGETGEFMGIIKPVSTEPVNTEPAVSTEPVKVEPVVETNSEVTNQEVTKPEVEKPANEPATRIISET